MLAGVTEGASARDEWIELALDYRCNLRCLGCRSCEDSGESLDGVAIRALLDGALARGVGKLWIGGGEPTLRNDLLSVIATARRLGFARVLLQTNGMRLAYPKFVDALVAAGVTDVSLNVKSHRASLHDTLSGREGCHALLVQALGELRRTSVRVVADVLLTRSTAEDLPETIARFAELGVRAFTLWLLSASDAREGGAHAAVQREVPRISELHAPVARAAAVARAAGVELVSMHTPPCTLPAPLRPLFLAARTLGMTVVDPSGRSFRLEDSPFEGGAWQEPCARCDARPECHGPRADYIRLHGASELAAIRMEPKPSAGDPR